MSRSILLSSCGAAALLAFSAGATFAQTATVGNVLQTTKNMNYVANDGWISIDGIHGDGSSVSISATGAASAVSLQSINGYWTGGGTLAAGNVRQTTTNYGYIGNDGYISGYASGVSGAGASASVSATGAQSAVSASRIGGNYYSTRTKIRSVRQNTTNYGNVSNRGTILNTYYGLYSGLSGNGSSVSVSATGAASAVAVSSINTGGSDTVSIGRRGRINQTTTNGGWYVDNRGFIPGSRWGDLSGHGASASVSATGAASSVSVSRIESAPMRSVRIGRVNQRTTNHADVTNQHAGRRYRSRYYTGTMTLGDLSGTGSSASISATGAASAVSYSSIEQHYSSRDSLSIRNVHQSTKNTGDVQNSGPTEHRRYRVYRPYYGSGIRFVSRYMPAGLHVGDLTGNGVSASISATGAASSVGVSKINDASSTRTSIGYVAQGTFNTGDINNYGKVYAGSLWGNGASVSVSATGAVSSVSYSVINSGYWGFNTLAVGPILQGTVNTGDVTNVGGATQTKTFYYRGRYVTVSTSYDPARVSVGHLKGAGTSASISASGAVSSVSFSTIGGGSDTWTSTPFILQGTANKGRILNYGRLYAGGLYGAGASVSISATGAASSVSISKINDYGHMHAFTGPIIQGTINKGAVTNKGYIHARSLYGNGTSASISAVGAASQVSVTRINGGPIAATTLGVAQLTINLAPINNYGTIYAGNLGGLGASASVSAVGAVSQVSSTSICHGCSSSFHTGPVAQATLNTGRINNAGTIRVGRLTGAGTSASVSALGAGSVVSASIISK